MAWRISYNVYLGSLWFVSVQSIGKSRRKKRNSKNTTMISHKTFQRQFLLSNIILKWYGLFYSSSSSSASPALALFHSFHSIRHLFFFFSIFEREHLIRSVGSVFSPGSLTRAYNIHHFKCWHSFSPQIHFFLSFFVLLRARFRGFFPPLTLLVSLSFLAFFLTSSFFFSPRTICSRVAHVFSIFACCGI